MSLLPATSHANPDTAFWAKAGSIALPNTSAFYGSPTLNTLITTTSAPATQIGNTITITTTETGYIWATVTANFTSNDNTDDHPISIYMIVNGTTSNVSTDYITRRTGGSPIRTLNMSANQRTNAMIPAGSYTVQVFAYTDASGVSGSHIRCDHLDVFALGNLV
jgi:hypothetical protein